MEPPLSVVQSRVLIAIAAGEELTVGAIVQRTGLSLKDAIPVLSQLLALRLVDAREERQADLLVRLYRRR